MAPDGSPTALAIVQRFLRNQGDAWSWLLDQLKGELDTIALIPAQESIQVEDALASLLQTVRTLGRRTAELHLAFATPTDDPAFSLEPMTMDDVRAAADDARRQGEKAFAAVVRLSRQAEGPAREAMEALLERREECWRLIERCVEVPDGAVKTRIHGDYHLGQVLIVQNDLMIVDFEGEPSRPVEERRAKGSPLRDVAGMLRSFAYVAETAARDVDLHFASRETDRLYEIARAAHQLSRTAFLESYREVAEGTPIWTADERSRWNLLDLHLLGKALYEINYEAGHRPDWIDIPIQGVLSILDQERSAS
jgi:maltose alpha-D-glucosyltransferase/alpha-amylase